MDICSGGDTLRSWAANFEDASHQKRQRGGVCTLFLLNFKECSSTKTP